MSFQGHKVSGKIWKSACLQCDFVIHRVIWGKRETGQMLVEIWTSSVIPLLIRGWYITHVWCCLKIPMAFLLLLMRGQVKFFHQSVALFISLLGERAGSVMKSRTHKDYGEAEVEL